MGNLALADLLVCLTFYPIWIIEFIQTLLNIESDQDLFCKLSRSTLRTFMFASATTLVAITVDRYLYFAKPLKYPLIVTRRRVFLTVSGIWLTACSLFIFIYAQVSGFGKVFRSLCVMLYSFILTLCHHLLAIFPLFLYFFSTSKFFWLPENNVSVSWLKERLLPSTIATSTWPKGWLVYFNFSSL